MKLKCTADDVVSYIITNYIYTYLMVIFLTKCIYFHSRGFRWKRISFSFLFIIKEKNKNAYIKIVLKNKMKFKNLQTFFFFFFFQLQSVEPNYITFSTTVEKMSNYVWDIRVTFVGSVTQKNKNTDAYRFTCILLKITI